jgi:alpha-1,3-rhamnosyl/mannosyltransferase
MPVLEAMSAGVPVLAANRAALPEVCGDAALLVDPEDVEEIAVGLERLMGDEGLREQLIARGLDRVAGFSWQKAAEQTWNVYQGLLI